MLPDTHEARSSSRASDGILPSQGGGTSSSRHALHADLMEQRSGAHAASMVDRLPVSSPDLDQRMGGHTACVVKHQGHAPQLKTNVVALKKSVGSQHQERILLGSSDVVSSYNRYCQLLAETRRFVGISVSRLDQVCVW